MTSSPELAELPPLPSMTMTCSLVPAAGLTVLLDLSPVLWVVGGGRVVEEETEGVVVSGGAVLLPSLLVCGLLRGLAGERGEECTECERG